MHQLPEKTLYGALILSSRHPTVLPNFRHSDFRQHLEGSNNGLVAIRSQFKYPTYQPARNRHYEVHSTAELSEDSASSFVKQFCSGEDLDVRTRISTASFSMSEPGLVCIEQLKPFGLTTLVSTDVEVNFVGVYGSGFEALLWSNVAGFADQLGSADTSASGSLWHYRFETRKNFGVALHSKRLCSRWYRYSQSDTMKEPAKRFQALERSLFSSSAEAL
jgi:hypothetical protein